MKKQIKLSVIITILISPLFIYGQGAIWLMIPSSATFCGMGEIGVCTPSDDIYAKYFNPANGVDGYHGISINYSQNDIHWLHNLADQIYYRNYNLGISLAPEKYPFQIVLNQSQNAIDFGNEPVVTNTGDLIKKLNSTHTSDNLTLSGKYSHQSRIPINIYLGVTRKNVRQEFVNQNYDVGEPFYYRSKNIFYDVGTIISSPIKLNYHGMKDIGILLTPAIGYSVQNIGDDITVISRPDPSPRTNSFGLSISAKLRHESGWNLIEYNGGRAVEDELVKFNFKKGEYEYQSVWGDIDIWDQVITSKTKSDVTLKRGNELKILDFIALRYGKRIYENGDIDLEEWGYSVYSNGLLYLLNYYTGKPIFSKIANYTSLSFNYAGWEESKHHPLDETRYHDFTFRVKNIDQLFSKDATYRKIPQKNSFAYLGNKCLSEFKVLGGISLSKYIIQDEEDLEGFDKQFLITPSFALETNILFLDFGIGYTPKGCKYEITKDWIYYEHHSNKKIEMKINYIDFYTHYSIDFLHRFSAYIGLQGGYPLKGKWKYLGEKVKFKKDELYMDVGIPMGFDINILNHFGIRTEYYHGLGDVYKNSYEKSSNHAISIKGFFKL